MAKKVLDANKKKVEKVVSEFKELLEQNGATVSEFQNNVILFYLGGRKYNSPKNDLHRWAPLVYRNGELYIIRRKRMTKKSVNHFAFCVRHAMRQAMKIIEKTPEEKELFYKEAKEMTKEELLEAILKLEAKVMKRLFITRNGKVEKTIYLEPENVFKIRKNTRGYFMLSNGAYQLTKYGLTVIKPKGFDIDYEFVEKDLKMIRYALCVMMDNAVPDYRYTDSYFTMAKLSSAISLNLHNTEVSDELYESFNPIDFDRPYYFQIWQAIIDELKPESSPRARSFKEGL